MATKEHKYIKMMRNEVKVSLFLLNAEFVPSEDPAVDSCKSIFDGSIEEVANNILNLKNRLLRESVVVKSNPPNTFIRFELEVDGSDGYPQVSLYGVRMESDLEYNERVKREMYALTAAKNAAKKRAERAAERKKEKEEEEYEIFLRLKKKFEIK